MNQLQLKDQELIKLLESKKSTAIEFYLKDLEQLRRELESLNLEPIQTQIYDRNERLKALLT